MSCNKSSVSESDTQWIIKYIEDPDHTGRVVEVGYRIIDGHALKDYVEFHSPSDGEVIYPYDPSLGGEMDYAPPDMRVFTPLSELIEEVGVERLLKFLYLYEKDIEVERGTPDFRCPVCGDTTYRGEICQDCLSSLPVQQQSDVYVQRDNRWLATKRILFTLKQGWVNWKVRVWFGCI